MGNSDSDKQTADTLFSYLNNVIFKPTHASLDLEALPDSFRDLGRGLQYLDFLLNETRIFAKELSKGNLDYPVPPPANEIASSLKMLHSSLKHLTWQTQQVAKGDYNQRVNFMGDFSAAFNNMVEQLEERHKISIDEKTMLEMYVHLILKNCPNPILLFDRQGKLVYVSDSYFQYYGKYNRDEVLGKGIHDLFLPIVSIKSLNIIEQLYENAITEEQMFETEQQIDFGDSQSPGHFKLQVTPMLDKGENVSGIIVFLFDITDSIIARDSAEYARDMAEKSSRSKSNFLARMSHEIRTPMNAVLGMAELSLREEIQPSVADHIRNIKQAGINLLSIINDILDFSKIEAGRLEIITVDYSLSTLFNDVINIIKMKIHESNLRFIINVDSNLPSVVHGDPVRIRQILLNILSNAVKYTKEGFVALSIEGKKTDDKTITLRIEVSDSGRGIKKEEIDLLFTDFARLEMEKNTSIEGTGLGLAITRSLSKAMNGKIELASEYGKGSIFTFILPQKIVSEDKLTVVENPEKKNILVFERREIYSESIEKTLNNLGVRCDFATTDSEFTRYLECNNYSHVFLPPYLYHEVKKFNSNFTANTNFALIVEFGEVIAENNVCVLPMPLYSLNVTDFLNDFPVRNEEKSTSEPMVTFTAPNAKIMIVDDVSINLDVAEGLLTPYEMEITLCKSGFEAIEKIKSKNFDLVFMDHMMPEMSGIEAVARIRTLNDGDSYFRNVPIVALTADAVSGTKEMFLKNNFNDYISKPIDIAKMNEVLEKWIPAEKKIILKPVSASRPV